MTILMAWACAVTIDVSDYGYMWVFGRPESSDWWLNVHGCPGAMRVASWFDERGAGLPDRYEGPFDLPSWCRVARIPDRPLPLVPAEVHEDVRGWPLLALWCRLDPEWYPAMPFRLTGGGLQLPPPQSALARWRQAYESRGPDDLRALPLRPVWPGFLLDTALYAVLWVLIVAAARWARRLVWPLGNLAYRRRHWLLLPYLVVLTVWALWILAPVAALDSGG